jgi:hypothetical protein
VPNKSALDIFRLLPVRDVAVEVLRLRRESPVEGALGLSSKDKLSRFKVPALSLDSESECELGGRSMTKEFQKIFW